MDIYLIRHGECESEGGGEDGPPLTPQGVEQTQKMSGHVLELGASPLALFSSPLRRAIQSAEPYCKIWELPLRSVDWLLPGTAPSVVLQRLREFKLERLALVGHLPILGLLLGVMVWGLPPKEIVIPRGGVACLQFSSWDPGTAKLKWLLAPDVFSANPPRPR